MDRLSTQFPTTCPHLKNNFCCMGGSEREAIESLTHFLHTHTPKIKFSFERNQDEGFRKKVKLAIGGMSNHPLIGLYLPGTHEVVDFECCRAHHPVIGKLITSLKNWISKNKISPYEESLGIGTLRYVQILVNDQEKVQMTLVLNKSLENPNLVRELMQEHPSIVSVWFNYQEQKTNTILGSRWEHFAGDSFLRLNVLENSFYVHPGAFVQNDVTLFSRILKDLSSHLNPCEKALDLYSGFGLFGLCLESYFSHIVFAETNSFAKLSYEKTIQAWGFEKGTYFNEDAKAVLLRNLDAGCIFVDPPRKGLEKEIKPILGQLNVGSTLVYVSCGYLSLIRDLKELLALGFELEWICGYDCFPKTGEVEVACILKRK